MATTGLQSYGESNAKRDWRFWAWKRLKKYCPVLPCQATVFFLSGPEPLDLDAAQKYGFRLKNLVAVDTNEDCVAAARKAGCIGIRGTLLDVISQWDEAPICGLMADYCCGLTCDSFGASRLLEISVDGGVCFNFQRGRESGALTAEWRRQLFPRLCDSLHRGQQYRRWSAVATALAIGGLHVDQDDPAYSDVVQFVSRDGWRLLNTFDSGDIDCIESRFPPCEFNEYRSSRVIMDSVVIDRRRVANGHEFMRRDIAVRRPRFTNKVNLRIDATKRNVTALKAIRTMRRAVK